MFRYAHLADIHIGGWRDPKMKDLSTQAFIAAVDHIIKEKLDFVLLSGDIFNTALPAIDKVKEVTKKLRELKDVGIPVYFIAGSHDFSPSGKTMLDVLEHAGLCRNVARGEVVDGQLKLAFTIDPKTGTKITGMLGKKGMLDRVYYENMLRDHLEAETGYKIFMFHTALSEFKPKELELMEAHPLSLLPKSFNYYAGGHVHYVFSREEPLYGLIAYPGPIFPNNFAELEKLRCGGFYIVTAVEKTTMEYVPIELHPVVSIVVDTQYRTSSQVTEEIMQRMQQLVVKNALVTLRVEGMLTDNNSIDFERIFSFCYQQGAYFMMKNTSKIRVKEFEEIKIDNTALDNAEEKIIEEHLGKSSLFAREQEKQLMVTLLQTLSLEKEDGERVLDFEERLLKDAKTVLPFMD